MSKIFKWDPKKHGYRLRFDFDVNIFRENLERFFIDFFKCIIKENKNLTASSIATLIPSTLAYYPNLLHANDKNKNAPKECANMITNDPNWRGAPIDRIINKAIPKTLFLDENGNVLDDYKTCTIDFKLTEDEKGTFTEVKVVESNELDTFELPCGVKNTSRRDETESQYLARYTYKKNSSPRILYVLNIWLKIEDVLKKISDYDANECLKTYFEQNKISVTSSQMTPPT